MMLLLRGLSWELRCLGFGAGCLCRMSDMAEGLTAAQVDEETRFGLRVRIRYLYDDKATKIQDEVFHLDAWLNTEKDGVSKI